MSRMSRLYHKSVPKAFFLLKPKLNTKLLVSLHSITLLVKQDVPETNIPDEIKWKKNIYFLRLKLKNKKCNKIYTEHPCLRFLSLTWGFVK